ncbi:MAG: M1 family aminopeptidase [Frankiaceae bacterium]
MLSGRTARLTGLVLTALLGLMAQVGCDASAPPRTSGSSVAEAPRSGDSCTRYRPPDPNRPVIRLVFRIGADHRTVTGSEHVAFRPGRVVRELVFRLWPNGPEGGRTRAWLSVSRARAAGRTGFDVTAAGARPGTQGTLLSLPLPEPVAPGSVVTADLDFAVHLPPPGWDRLGSDGRTAWWASAYPMLAWQQQGGWARDPASPLPGETATSEAADTRVTVMAPAADTVLAAGTADPPQPAAGRQRIWRFHAPMARDVAVAVGRFQLATADVADPAGTPTPVTVAVAPGVQSSARDVLAQVRRALPQLSARFGPVPFTAIRLASLPGLVQSGIEYPGAILLLGPRPPMRLVTHELAHQWFYALVGNNQARYPWLDEAFASYAETVVTGPPDARAALSQTRPGPVGASMASFGADYARYVEAVYDSGARALAAARDLAGATAFDHAIRCYLDDLSWRIATPADLASHLRSLPPALAVLRRSGAL